MFTCFDLKNRYYKIPVRHREEWRMAFKTCEMLHEWKVMLFGVFNGRSTFMQVMNQHL